MAAAIPVALPSTPLCAKLAEPMNCEGSVGARLMMQMMGWKAGCGLGRQEQVKPNACQLTPRTREIYGDASGHLSYRPCGCAACLCGGRATVIKGKGMPPLVYGNEPASPFTN